MNSNYLIVLALMSACALVSLPAYSTATSGLQGAVKAAGSRGYARLSDDPVKVKNMVEAIQTGNVLLATKLLDDWPINARFDDKRRTIAHYAVIHEDSDLLSMLIHREANLNMIDVDGYTPYDIWQEKGGSLPAGDEPRDRISLLLKKAKALGAEQVSKGKKFYHDFFTSRLLEAAEAGDRKLVERFLSLGADPLQPTLMINPTSRHEKDPSGVQRGNKKLVHTLPIHLAIENGYPDIAAILLAAMNNREDKTSKLERGHTYDAPLAWGVHYRSWNPVQWAIFAEDWVMAEELLRNGANLNSLNLEPNTGVSEESLARYDGSLHKSGSYYSSRMDAYDVAKLIGQEDELLKLITDVEIDRDDLILTLVHRASTTGKTDIFDKLIKHGVDLRAGEKSDMAIKFALAKPNYSALEYLIRLRQGLEPVKTEAERTDSEGNTVAKRDDSLNEYVGLADNGKISLLSLALRYGADPDGDRTPLGETLLLRSYKLNQRYYRGEVAKILFDYGANPNIADNDGNTALSHVVAQLQGWVEFPIALKWIMTDIKELLAYEANPNVQTQDTGKTPLHVAILSAPDYSDGGMVYVLDTIKLLVEHGADPKIKDSKGHDAFDYAEQIEDEQKREQILEILRSSPTSAQK